jgi:hypothetical protein
LHRSTTTSVTSGLEDRIVITSARNASNGIARGSLAWCGPISSVCTYGGTSSITSVVVPFSWYRSDCVYEWMAALVAQ